MTKLKRQLSIVHCALCIAISAHGAEIATTIDRYVQDGLIACWDGIENAGIGIHSGTTNIWKDLVGSRDLTLTANGSWSGAGNALIVSGYSAYASEGAPAYKTIEVVYRMTSTSGRILFWSGNDTTRWVLFDTNGTTGYFDGRTPAVASKKVAWTFDSSAIRTMSATYNDSGIVEAVYGNGEDHSSDGTHSNYWNPGVSKMAIGNRSPSGGKNFNSAHNWSGEVYAIRLYDRQLTNAEIAANHNVDVVRFIFGDLDDVLRVTGSPRDIGFPSPAYGETNGLASGESFTVSCGATSVTNDAGTTQYSYTGWKLYDATNAVVSTGSGTSFIYIHPSPSEYRRLEWQWEATLVEGTIAAGVGGSVSQSGTDWYAPGTPVTVTATPNAGMRFVRWAGTLPDGIDANSATITFTPSSPFNMMAMFGAAPSCVETFPMEGDTLFDATAANAIGVDSREGVAADDGVRSIDALPPLAIGYSPSWFGGAYPPAWEPADDSYAVVEKVVGVGTPEETRTTIKTGDSGEEGTVAYSPASGQEKRIRLIHTAYDGSGAVIGSPLVRDINILTPKGMIIIMR